MLIISQPYLKGDDLLMLSPRFVSTAPDWPKTTTSSYCGFNVGEIVVMIY